MVTKCLLDSQYTTVDLLTIDLEKQRTCGNLLHINIISWIPATDTDKLKKDSDIIIVPGDKGRATCVIDSAVYEEKANALLQDVNVYEQLKKDPTQKYQTKLIKLLKDLKDKGAIDSRTYWKLYPTVCDVPKFDGLIKIHKAGAPLRPIISSIGSVTYELARFVSGIISPLIGNTEHHISNTQSFVEDIRDLQLDPDESLVSFDVSALFTSIPVDKTLEVVGELLKSDSSWKKGEAENLEPEQVLDCLRFCLGTSYCVFRETFYLQRYGCAMGSSCSPLSADAYMEYFESQALTSAPHPPRIWKRYVDDTFVVIKSTHIEQFTDHINNIDPNIKFTREEVEDGKLPFLDTLVCRQQDGTLKVKVYRKPTHTEQYLNFSSHHPLEHKLSVVRTLLHRAETVVTDQTDKEEEIAHVKNALRNCGYKDWTFFRDQPKEKDRASQNPDSETANKGFVTLPYIEGLSEKLRRAFRTAGVSTSFKPQNTLRSALVAPKDKTEPIKQSGIVYEITCADCDASYIGESARKLEKRISEHKSTAGSSNQRSGST
ncbi:uncharacterized protein [Amphiura filiformis]|uniref:uncharacterized protein n=1 Tax=Amphiura filiformis TaxID=82378 RepID=UPI003B20D348